VLSAINLYGLELGKSFDPEALEILMKEELKKESKCCKYI